MDIVGAFKVDCELQELTRKREPARTAGVMVDAGSEYTWLPEELLARDPAGDSSHPPDRDGRAAVGFVATIQLLVPRLVLVAVEDHQMPLRRRAAAPKSSRADWPTSTLTYTQR